MDPVKKIDWRANPEVVCEARKPMQPHLSERPSPSLPMDHDQEIVSTVPSLRARSITERTQGTRQRRRKKGTIMLNEQTFDKLYAMKLIGMSEGFKEQLEQSSCRDLSFEERFGMLVDRQWLWKENQRLKRLLQDAKLKLQASWRISTTEPPEALKNPSSSASLPVSGSAVTKIFSSPVLQAWGKPSLPAPLPRRPVGRLPYLLPSLPSVLLPGRSGPSRWELQHSDQKALQNSSSCFGRSRISPLTDTERRDLLEVIEDRSGSTSTLITSQLPIDRWHDHIGTRPLPMPLWTG